MNVSLSADEELALDLAQRVGSLLMELRAASELHGQELGDAGDYRANALIVAELEAQRPDDAILSEEAAADRRRSSSDRVWIVDPLDGTREFQTPGHDDWAVHIALWHRDSGLIAGAVGLPAHGVVFTSADDAAGSAGLLPDSTVPRIVVSRSRAPDFAESVSRATGAEVTPLGSAGAKAMAVVGGEAVAYVHAGGQYEWDSAAPVAVASAAGMDCCRADGSPLRYNCDDLYLPDLVISHPEYTDAVLAAIAESNANLA